MQRIGFDTRLSTNASKHTVGTVRMVEVADCMALLSLCFGCHLGHMHCAHSHAICHIQAYGSAANNRFCLCLSFW